MGRRRVAARWVAVTPPPHGFVYAVFDNRHGLIDWGLRFPGRAEDAVRRKLAPVLRRADAIAVVTECHLQTRRQAAGRRFCRIVHEVAADLPIVRVTLAEVQREAEGAKSKWEIAERIAARFPELRPRLPPRRKLWTSEDDRTGVFCAVAMTLAAEERVRAAARGR